MGSAEDDTPTKTPKSSSTQEQNQTPNSSTTQEHPPSSPATIFPDWTSYQAYYNSVGTPPIPPPGFFHSPVASSPQAHTYMWGQHMLPPYGTPPPPYVAMYPHGGLYSHPSMAPGSYPYGPCAMLSPNGTAEPSASMAGSKELEGKSGEGKSKLPLKRSKGSLGSLSMLTGKENEMEKASGASENGGGFSHSDESHGESSSEGTDAKSHNGSQQSGKDSADARIQNGDAGSNLPSGANQVAINQSVVMAVPPGSVPCPTTNLNIGMDYWGGSGPSQVPTSRSKLPTKSAAGVIVPSGVIGSRDGVPSELWIPDERELKRQRRKQSNRESARRSRLRKQAEYDELAQRVETLKEENNTLQEELKCMREDYEKLASENASLTDKLQIYLGEDLRADGIHEQTGADTQVEATI